MSEWKKIPSSTAARNTSNPIRQIVDQMVLKPETDKAPIPLSIGDPCTDGNLLPPKEVTEAMKLILDENKNNGYPPSAGMEPTRVSIAKKFPGHEKYPCKSSDVFVTSGASHALQMAFDGILEPGENILLPLPGFSLYKTICDSKGFETNFYKLKPENNWEVDLADVKSKINSKTKAIFINNPSNPCGSSFSKQHLLDILAVAREAKLPVISDEIYDGVVFEGEEFHSIATLSDDVPCMVIGGLAKLYVIPGWRLGWIIVHDRNGVLEDVRTGLLQLSTMILGPNSLVQAAVPTFLEKVPKSYTDFIVQTLSKHAKVTYEAMEKIPGLKPIKPQGAMYCMVGIDRDQYPTFASEVEFSRELLREQAVMVLPGSCFGFENYFRIVFTKPQEKLEEAYARIAEFCAKHRKQ